MDVVACGELLLVGVVEWVREGEISIWLLVRAWFVPCGCKRGPHPKMYLQVLALLFISALPAAAPQWAPASHPKPKGEGAGWHVQAMRRARHWRVCLAAVPLLLAAGMLLGNWRPQHLVCVGWCMCQGSNLLPPASSPIRHIPCCSFATNVRGCCGLCVHHMV